MLKRDLLLAPVCEAALLFLAAVIAWLVHDLCQSGSYGL